MSEFVKIEEFTALKEEVKEIKQDMLESNKILQNIDKKIDVINEKIANSGTVTTLRIEPLENRVTKLEDSQLWLRRAIIGGVFAIISEAIVFIIKLM